MASLIFQRLETGPFQGIDKDNPIVIEFPPKSLKSKKKPITLVTGDQERGKSSLIHSLLYGLGYKFGFKQENLVNLNSEKMQGEIEFTSDGHTWKVRYTKSKFELFRQFTVNDRDPAWIPQGEAHTRLKQLVGNIAVSPMKLRTDDGKKQVDYLFQILNVPEEIVKQIKALSANIETAVGTRAEVNRQYTFLKQTLEENTLYQNWEESEKKYAEYKTIESAKAKLTEAERNKRTLAQARDRMATLEQKKVDKKKEIEELQEKFKKAKEELAAIEGAEKMGNTFIRQIKGADNEYDQALKEFTEITEYQAEQRQWEYVKSRKTEMDEYEDLLQNSDASKERIKTQKRDLLKKTLPAIEGFEVLTEESIDGQRPGVYFHGKSPIQLSESELFNLYLQLVQATGVRIIVIENISSFGTEVVETLNTLARSGVYVWATEMRRGQQELRIEFIDQLT